MRFSMTLSSAHYLLAKAKFACVEFTASVKALLTALSSGALPLLAFGAA